MAIYEMGPAGTAMEKVVIDWLNGKVGFGDTADGFITSGGTLANLTALLSARQAMVDSDIWEDGMNEKLAVMVSSEAHYCIDRALRIMGFGSDGIIKVPVGDDFTIQISLLEEYYQDAISKGLNVIAVVGNAPSTSSGRYDDLEALGAFAKAKGLWFHVDGAHGGAAILSEKYRKLTRGINEADSVAIDGHKMLMTPTILTFLLFRDKQNSNATFRQKAQYLLSRSGEDEWYNIASKSFECTKRMMSIQFYILLKYYGEGIFDEFVTKQFDLGRNFAEKIEARGNFDLPYQPDSNIVCFRYYREGLPVSELNAINKKIRVTLLEEGSFYIVQTTLNEVVYLRTTLASPETNGEDLELLLDKIELLAGEL
jgi:L-2,4-diaminobutyrate decarboxylase